MTKQHKHAEVLRAIADGKEVECYSYLPEAWVQPILSHVNPFNCQNAKWRIKPETIKIGNHEFPKPMTEAPEIGSDYYVVNFYYELYYPATWSDDKEDIELLERGACHATKEAAIAHTKALIAISQGK